MKSNFEIKYFLKILIINILIFIVLMIGSVFFEFLFLGWGASDKSPDFNADFALISQMLVIGFLTIRKRNNRINAEMITVLLIIILTYLILKFGIEFI